ncbi:S-layer homology domain-containing protein [Lysinibacillus sphaericus]|uniref:S-layer homology domain-containing protein n=1 Tax=Lysinibacillus sphaericus TaxID=1421 RepID=UPI003CFCC0AB
MKKNKRVGLVVLTFLLSVIVPDFAPHAAGATVTKSYTATADTMDLRGHQDYDGVYDNVDDGLLYVGMSNNDGFVNVRNRMATTFDLGVPEGNIVSAELGLTVATVIRNPGQTLYMEARGSAADDLNYVNFPSIDTNSPYADKFTAKSTAEVPMGTYLENQTIMLNVKSAIDAFTDSSDRKITFILNGNEADADSGRFLLYSLENSNAAFRPKLIVTYETGTLANNPPVGSFTILEGAMTSTSTVNLSITGSDPDIGDSVTHMRFANSAANLSAASWLPFSNTATFSLTGGDGAKTIYMQLRDSNNGISANSSQSILLDQTAPTGTLIINEGATWTKSDTVTLKGTYTDGSGSGVEQARLSNIIGSWQTSWFNIADLNGKSWALPAGGGAKTIYVQFKDKVGNTSTGTISSMITVDTIAPIISNVEHGKVYNNKVNAVFNEGSGLLNGNPYTSGTDITQDGTYTLIVTDTAGNSATVTFKIDTTAPIVTGVTNDGIYKSNVTVTFNEGTATLNGTALISGMLVTMDGMYTLVVTDSAGNVTTVNFMIDTEAPLVTGVTNGGIYKDKVTITFNEGTATLNGAAFASGTEIGHDGSYTLIVTDAAGNVTTVNFMIDRTAPTVTGITNGGAYKDKVTIGFNKGTATLNGVAFTSGTEVDQEGMYTFVLTDASGHVTTIHFTIDKTAPTVTGVTNGGNYKDKVTVGFNEGTATLNGVIFASGHEINQDGSYTLVVADTAGNVTTISFTIDSTAPTVTGVTNGGVYKDKVTIVFNKGTATLNGVAFTSETKVDKEGTYTLVVTNPAGRVTTINFKIDRTAPTGTIVINGGSATTNSNSVTLSLTSSDGSGSGVAEMRFSTDELKWSAWEKVSLSKKWSFTEEVGQKKLYVQFRDAAGNSSITSMATIDYRPSGGSDSGSSNNGGSGSNNSTTNNSNSGNSNSNVGNESPPTQIVTTNGIITVPVGSSGETSVGEDINVSIPVGVAQQELTITVEKLRDITNLLSNGQRLISPIFELHKNSAGNIKKPLTLTMKFDSSKVGKDQYAFIFSYDPLKKEWLEMKGTTKGDFITISTDEFTKFAVFIVDKSQPISFSDINGHWAQDMIEDIAARGIITGYLDGSFRPNEPIQRQHVAVMVARGFQLTAKRDAVAFSDVPTSHPYDEAITLLQQAGIVDGSKGAFYPNANMTRAQLAKILVLAFGITPSGTSTFQDVPVTHWSHDYIAALADNGIALGDKGNFRPDEFVTRAQFVAFLYRALNQ